MDIERAVDDFVSRGKDLFHRLGLEGETLSDLALGILQTQLHILKVESARILRTRVKDQRNPTSSKILPGRPAQKVTSPDNQCLHSRLIDDFVSKEGKTLVYCLECRTVIQDPQIEET